jgi:hypothetical protein
MTDHERDDEALPAPEQLAKSQQACQSRQPDIDVIVAGDEGTADQRAEMSVREVVQVGAQVIDHAALHLRAQRHHGGGDDYQHHGVSRGDTHQRQPRQHTRHNTDDSNGVLPP